MRPESPIMLLLLRSLSQSCRFTIVRSVQRLMHVTDEMQQVLKRRHAVRASCAESPLSISSITTSLRGPRGSIPGRQLLRMAEAGAIDVRPVELEIHETPSALASSGPWSNFDGSRGKRRCKWPHERGPGAELAIIAGEYRLHLLGAPEARGSHQRRHLMPFISPGRSELRHRAPAGAASGSRSTPQRLYRAAPRGEFRARQGPGRKSRAFASGNCSAASHGRMPVRPHER